MKIRIIGAGVMGRGIAQWAAQAGHAVELADGRPEAVGDALAFVGGMLRRAVEKGRADAAEADAALARIVPLDDPAAPGDGVDLLVEAIHEDFEAKAELLARLERVLPARTVFATNTSSLSVTRLASRLADPSRLAGLHFFNPVPLMKLVEVVPGALTRPDIPGLLAGLVSATGHRAVVVADTPGFLVNHVGRGLNTEALALLEEGVAEPAELDGIARDVLGLRMGPFELMDLTGLDVTAAVMEGVWEGFRYSERLRPSYLTPNRVSAGLLGRKTGRGFYDHSGTSGSGGVPPVPAAGGDASRSVWLGGAEAEPLRPVLADAAEDGPEPSERAIILVPTWGDTVASVIAERALPRDRVLGVDPLSIGSPRLVLTATPATDPAVLGDARAVLARAGVAVSVTRDTAGSAAQRLLASIISVACSVAERSIASPADIDAASTAGLGYPYGPLAWGERIGADRLLRLQRNLYATTGDPRYRPTRWLTERAQLGLPLTQPSFPAG
ncbi:3-hydroxyacyl-CoA dehydrogenase [Nonomuraea wenchangensis]|uniref:3-hydroxyacyl-CoA dehydrogenase n=1 Tax=Nonomuraea wenchangensis TaxID=568860 RepID=UPI00332EF52E